MAYLFAAYGFIWLVLFVYLRFLQTRLKRIETEIDRLKDAVEKA